MTVLEMNNNICEKVGDYLKINPDSLQSTDVKERVRELCVAKLCEVVGVHCKFNFRNDFFTFFSSFVGQAILNKLSLNLEIASKDLTIVRHDGINLVDEVVRLLNQEDMDDAFLDAFNLADDNKYLLDRIKIKA